MKIELNKIYHGDCINIMPNIKSNSVDMILCDLPYAVTKNKWDLKINLNKLQEQYMRIIKEKGVIVLTAQQPFTTLIINCFTKTFRYSLIWQKTTPTGFLNANRMPLRIHEDILVFYKKLCTYNPQKTSGHTRKVSTAVHKRNSKKTTNYGKHNLHTYDSTERYPTSILKFSTDKQKLSLHPTQKPIDLFEYLIKTYSNEGDLVLDNCIGSGTTAVACKNTKRNFIGIEKEKKCFKIANKRLEQNTLLGA